jgi:hypothetical protein
MPKLARKEKQTNKQTNKPCGKTAELWVRQKKKSILQFEEPMTA